MPLRTHKPTQTQQLPNHQRCPSNPTSVHQLNNFKRSKQTHKNKSTTPTKKQLSKSNQSPIVIKKSHTNLINPIDVSRMRLALGFNV
jgi:hypothetical protein